MSSTPLPIPKQFDPDSVWHGWMFALHTVVDAIHEIAADQTNWMLVITGIDEWLQQYQDDPEKFRERYRRFLFMEGLKSLE